MNNARAQSIVNNLTSIALKVYEAVPITQAWTFAEVNAEIVRHGGRHDQAQIRGCLKSLVDQGLIRERANGTFQREALKPNRPTLVRAQESTMPQVAEKVKVEPLDAIAHIAKSMRATAHAMLEQADVLENTALDYAIVAMRQWHAAGDEDVMALKSRALSAEAEVDRVRATSAAMLFKLPDELLIGDLRAESDNIHDRLRACSMLFKLVNELQEHMAAHLQPDGPSKQAFVERVIGLIDGPRWFEIARFMTPRPHG